jgi:hypothetical protein
MANKPRASSRTSATFSKPTLWAFAFLVSSFIWLIAKRDEVDSTVLDVAVRLVGVPDYIDALPEPPEVSVALQFPRGLKPEIKSENFEIVLDLGSFRPRDDWSRFVRATERGSEAVSLDRSNFTLGQDKNLPLEQVNIERFNPGRVLVEAIYRGKQVKVEPRVQGEPATDYVVNFARLQVEPKEVFLVGPPGALDGIDRVFTRPVSVERAEASLSVETRLDLPDSLASAPPNARQRVTVAVAVEPVLVERVFEGAPVRVPAIAQNIEIVTDPPFVSVYARGPKNLIEALDSDDFTFLLEGEIEEVAGKTYADLRVTARARRDLPRAAEGVYEVIRVEPNVLDVVVREAAPKE